LKVILTKDFEKLGSLGDIVKVKDGYAKNFLIPNKIAVLANEGNIKQVELVKKSLVKKEAKNIEEAKQVAEQLKELEIVFKVKASPDGKLYGSITGKDIADEIFKQRKVEIDKKKIELESHLKDLGEYEIEIKLYKDIKSKIKVILESEDELEGEGEDQKVEDLKAGEELNNEESS